MEGGCIEKLAFADVTNFASITIDSAKDLL